MHYLRTWFFLDTVSNMIVAITLVITFSGTPHQIWLWESIIGPTFKKVKEVNHGSLTTANKDILD